MYYEIQVFDLFGRMVYSYKQEKFLGVNDIAVDLSSHPPGIYDLRFISRGKVATRSIVLN